MTNAGQPMVGISSTKSPPGHCMLPKCLDQSHPGTTTSAVLISSLASWTCTTGLQFPHLTGVNSCAILSVFLEQWKVRQCFFKSCFPGSRQSLIQVPKLSPHPVRMSTWKEKISSGWACWDIADPKCLLTCIHVWVSALRVHVLQSNTNIGQCVTWSVPIVWN